MSLLGQLVRAQSLTRGTGNPGTLDPGTRDPGTRDPETRDHGTGNSGTDRLWRPIADRSLSAWMFVGLVFTTVFAESHVVDLPIGPHRVFLVLTLLALFNERVGKFRRPRLRPVHVVMIAALLWATGSAIAAGTIGSSYGQFALLDRMAMPYLGFVLAPLVFRTPRDRDLLLKCLVLIGLYLGVTAYFEIIGPRSLVWPSVINDPAAGMHYGRARGPFLVAEPDGLVMVICAFAAWYGLWRLHHVWRLVCLATVVMASLGCLLTLTRGCWLAFLAAFVVAGLRDTRLRTWLPVATVLVIGGLLAALTLLPAMKSAANDRLDSEGPVRDRVTTNAAAIRAVEEHPLYGVGWMRFLSVGQDYARQADDEPMGFAGIEAHNVLLARTAELGLPGVALWLGAAALGPGRVLLPRRRRPGEKLGVVSRILGPAEPTGWITIAVATTCAWAALSMSSPLPYALPNMLVFMFAGMALADREEATG